MDAFTKIAEQRILEAIEAGEFDDLEGKGKPLPPDELQMVVAPEIRLAYRIMKNANVLPVEIEALREVERIEQLLPLVDEENERYQYVRRMNALITTFNMMHRTPVFLERNQRYTHKIGEKLIKNKP
ncbi:MAG TPA: DUF1992 domain-containing protein [Thermodesulfobacteriota bacterium]|nr:DUF1992 domain-containing protein [Deltaproteobacteria bacterium]HNR11729.1 DUF1992 domain-containing protein [Thermodesulfobacteriota bacterium]HNU70665.1 DUF1992 domain-containing protein [Thermodesulfobacteriota bacterium]HOC38740.1 DUF1992 domain-containing protein [Thermodesulfobacteriota bacterium]HQO77512.1 DUF1992 domain-containing protein [Thermodesulfobacteriota bacterium]